MVNASEKFVLNPNVNTVRSDEVTGRNLLKASTTLNTGYNLIGIFQEHSVTANNSVRGAFGAIDGSRVDRVLGQSNVGTRQVNDVIRESTGNSPKDMIPGEAYWMKLTGSGDAVYAEPLIGGG